MFTVAVCITLLSIVILMQVFRINDIDKKIDDILDLLERTPNGKNRKKKE